MARILSQTLIRESQALIHDPPPSFRSPFFASRFINSRGQSKRPEKAQLVELDLGSEGQPESESGPGPGSASMRMLREAIHAIVIRRAAPDWLPFVPGSSYWIPPAPPRKASTMTEEEEMSLSSLRGWPSFSYFVEGVLPNVVDNRPEKATNNPEKASPKSDVEEIGVQSTDKTVGFLPNVVDNSPEKASNSPEKASNSSEMASAKSDDEEGGLIY